MATRSGYQILIKGFVQVDPKNLAQHKAALEAVELAQSGAKGGSLDALFKLMEIEEFAVKPVQRRGE